MWKVSVIFELESGLLGHGLQFPCYTSAKKTKKRLYTVFGKIFLVVNKVNKKWCCVVVAIRDIRVKAKNTAKSPQKANKNRSIPTDRPKGWATISALAIEPIKK